MKLVINRRHSVPTAMKWQTISLMLAMVVAAVVSSPPTGEICKMCSCSDAGIVTCICKDTNKLRHIIVEPTSFEDCSKLRKFEVRGCQSLTFVTNALRDAHILETLSVIQTNNVSFEMGVFHTLDSLVIDSVDSLILKQSAFQGAKNISNILIKKSKIPLIPKWALDNLPDVREIRIEDTIVEKIETKAVFINMPHYGSNVVIQRSEFGTVEESGVRIGNATDITMDGCLIEKGYTSSIKLSSWQSMTLKGNVISENVDVNGILVLCNRSIEFTDNVLKNINISVPERSHAFLNKTSSTLERLAFENGGNQIPCECPDHDSNTTGEFFKNFCLNGCKEATLDSFLRICQENKNLTTTTAAILKKICSGKVPLTTPAAPTASPIVSTTPRSLASQLTVSNVNSYLTQLCLIILYINL